MDDYRVQLDVYHGPLDLLLYLIEQNELDIFNIPIAQVTEHYIAHLKSMQTLDVNLAGEFLLMAATLMEIKSALMAHEAVAAEAAASGLTPAQDPMDPRHELIQQLLAYKRFKDCAEALDRRRKLTGLRYPRRPAGIAGMEEAAERDLDLSDCSAWDLLGVWSNLMSQVGGPRRLDLVDDDTPIELHQEDILDRLAREGTLTLQTMFHGRRPSEMTGLFLATLELVRQRRLHVLQEIPAGPIRLEPCTTPAEAEPESTGPVRRTTHDPAKADHFEWSTEEIYQRYLKRQERRAKGEKIQEDTELEEDIRAIEAKEAGLETPNPQISDEEAEEEAEEKPADP